VTIADLNDRGGEAVAAEICKKGGEAQLAHAGISEEAKVKSMIENARSAFGPLHGAINNAGIPPLQSQGRGFRQPDHERRTALLASQSDEAVYQPGHQGERHVHEHR
jgi:NAD(P)-dependent dehydrogenase (short-subunit alcohol dehydrogenase family)